MVLSLTDMSVLFQATSKDVHYNVFHPNTKSSRAHPNEHFITSKAPFSVFHDWYISLESAFVATGPISGVVILGFNYYVKQP